MFKNNRSLKTFGIILIIFAFVLVYMFYSNYSQTKGDFSLGDDAIQEEINFSKVEKQTGTNNQVNYIITDANNDSIKYNIPGFASGDFKYDLFTSKVVVGDTVKLYIMYKDDSSKIYYVIGVEAVVAEENNVFLDYKTESDNYKTQIEKTRTTAFITLGVGGVCLLAGIAFLVIRFFNMKKEQEAYKQSLIDYTNAPTKVCPNTYYKKESIYNNSKIACFGADQFDPLDNPNITKIDYVKMAYHFTDLELPRTSAVKDVSQIDTQALVDLVNASYGKEKYKLNDIESLKAKAIYSPGLWLGYYEEDELVGLLIGDFDSKVKEASIEQIVVKENYRRQGKATSLVYEFLARVKEKAYVATVFARCDVKGLPNPVDLFRHCGYGEEYHWYVINRADKDIVKLK